MANQHFFDNCKDGAYIINTSCGKVLETSALVKAIKSRKVRGACLDVLEYEQISFEDYRQLTLILSGYANPTELY